MSSVVSHDSETRAQGQQVITACAFIHHTFDIVPKVFMPRRAQTKKFLPGVYELPGGHIDFGEDIVEGLKREIFEEFGMHVRVGDPFYVFTYMNQVKGSHSIEVIYFAQFIDPIEKISLNPSDHSVYKWFEEREIPHLESGEKGAQDPEIAALYKGFAFIRGERPTKG